MNAYVQGRIWRYLRRFPGSTPKQVREALSLTQDGAGQAFARMMKEGTGRAEGHSTGRTWYCAGDEPKDLRPLPRGQPKRTAEPTIWKPEPVLELERCMGFAAPMPIILGKLHKYRMERKVRTKGAESAHSRREVTSVTEAAD